MDFRLWFFILFSWSEVGTISFNIYWRVISKNDDLLCRPTDWDKPVFLRLEKVWWIVHDITESSWPLLYGVGLFSRPLACHLTSFIYENESRCLSVLWAREALLISCYDRLELKYHKLDLLVSYITHVRLVNYGLACIVVVGCGIA